MTNEKKIEAIAAMLHDYDLHTGSRAAADVLQHPDKWVVFDHFPIYQAAASLLLGIRENMDRRNASPSALSACKRILKACPRKDNRFVFSQDGRFCLCSGYHAVRLKDDLPSLPHYDPENTDHSRPINLSSVFKAATDASSIEIQLPSITELKTWIASQKSVAGKGYMKIPYEIDCGAFRIGFNPSYLLDMLQVLPDAHVFVSSPISAAYFTAANGDGVLLPVRLKSDAEKKAA